MLARAARGAGAIFCMPRAKPLKRAALTGYAARLMTTAQLLTRHLEFLRAELPRLANGLIDGWSEALRGVAAGGSGDSAQLARPLATLLAREHAAFSGALLRELGEGLQAPAVRRDAGAAPRRALTDLDALSLVDEDQAERDIEISRIVQAVDLRAEWEWRELLGLLNGLQEGGDAGLRLDAQSHPASPLAVARALAKAVLVLQPTPAQRALLMRLAIPLCAELLKPIYERTGQWLRAQGAQQGVYRIRGASMELRAPAGLPEAAAALRLAGGTPAGSDPAAQSQALLSRLFDQIGRDPRLDRAVQQSILRLELAVLRLAQADPSLLLDEQHPTWALINQLAAHATELPAAAGDRATDFQAFVAPLVEQLSAKPERAQFEQALQQVQRYIDRDAEQQLAASADVRASLAEREREREWQPLLLQQVQDQLRGRGVVIDDTLRQFLTGPWVEVMARTLAREGADTEAAQAVVHTVDDPLASLQRPTGEADRQRLVQSLPALIARVERGMALIELPPPHRERVMEALMQGHRRSLFSAAPAAPAAEAAPSTVIEWDDAAYAAQQAQQPDWQPSSDTHLGLLATVPMSLDQQAAGADIARWLAGLQVGQRMKIFLLGQWTTARLIWRSDNGQFFMLSSALGSGSHSLTRRALERLRAEGLVTEVQDASLLSRAVEGLIDSTRPAPL